MERKEICHLHFAFEWGNLCVDLFDVMINRDDVHFHQRVFFFFTLFFSFSFFCFVLLFSSSIGRACDVFPIIESRNTASTDVQHNRWCFNGWRWFESRFAFVLLITTIFQTTINCWIIQFDIVNGVTLGKIDIYWISCRTLFAKQTPFSFWLNWAFLAVTRLCDYCYFNWLPLTVSFV